MIKSIIRIQYDKLKKYDSIVFYDYFKLFSNNKIIGILMYFVGKL